MAKPSIDDAISLLRDAKRSSTEDLLGIVRTVSSQFEDRVETLRALVDQGELSFHDSEHGDGKALLSAALLAIVLGDVYPLSPLKDEQIATIEAACNVLGIRYKDVLQMTSREQQLLKALEG